MTISVLGVQPRYFIRPKNTDWRHNIFLEESFAERNIIHDAQVKFTLRRSLESFVSMNFRHLRGKLGSIPIAGQNLKKKDYFIKLFSSDSIAKYDVIYSYGCYPVGTDKPVVWHTGPTDVELLSKRGVSSDDIKREIDSKAVSASNSKLISVSSETGLIAFDQQFPGYREKIIVLPFIIPNIIEIDNSEILEKHSQESLNIVFVGREAKRKGLDLVLGAYAQLISNSKRKITLTIVSDFSGGHIDIPSSLNVVWHRSLDHSGVQKLMRSAHILVMPSREESYGLVYLEAMAAGAVPIAPNREPQISLLDGGNCGSLCELTVEGVFDALERLVSNDQLRSTLALNGINKYKAFFSKDSVMTCYERAFIRAAN